MKVLVTGGSGLLGGKIIEAGKQSLDLVGCSWESDVSVRGVRSLRFDVADRAETVRAIGEERPDVIIHTAAFTNVDSCEENRNRAWSVNVEGTRNVVDSARLSLAKFVFVSTDYVFDGNSGPYSEEARPNPVNYYGLTKLEGEKIASETTGALIIRSTVIFGLSEARKPNFASWVIEQLEQGKTMRAVTDQCGTPTFADNAAEMILKLVESNRSGIYNVAGSDYLSRFEFASAIANSFGFRPTLIQPVTTTQLAQRARRPLRAGLTNEKVERDLNVKMMTVSQALPMLKSQWQKRKKST